MKTLIHILFALLLTTVGASAGANIKITWDAPIATDPQPSGYALWRKGGTATAPTWTLVRRYDTGTVLTTRIIDITADGAGTYTLTAYNAGGESERSDEFTIPGKPGKPAGVRVTIELTP